MQPHPLNEPEVIVEKIARRHNLSFSDAMKVVERDPRLAAEIDNKPFSDTADIDERRKVNGVLDVNGPEGVLEDNNRYVVGREMQQQEYNDRAIRNGESDLNGPEAVLAPEDIEYYNRVVRERSRRQRESGKAQPSAEPPRDDRSQLNSRKSDTVKASTGVGRNAGGHFRPNITPQDRDRENIFYGGTTPRYGGQQAWRNNADRKPTGSQTGQHSARGDAFPIQETIGRGGPISGQDQERVEGAMNALGYLGTPYRNITVGRVSAPLAGAIERFQSDNNLKPDGVMAPNGPTARGVQSALSGRTHRSSEPV